MKEFVEKLKHKLDIQFFAEGGDENSDNPETNNEDDEEQDEEQDEPRTFTQEEVSRIMSKEKKEGRRAVYTTLGIDAKDKNLIEEVKQFIVSKKNNGGESKSSKDDGIKETKLVDDKTILLEQKLLIANTKAEAMKLGVRPEYVDDLVTLAMINIEDEDDVGEAVLALKSKYKVWFVEEEEDTNKAKKKQGTGSSFKDKNKKDGEVSVGERLAKMRAEQIKKSSYFGGKEK
jgi:hypothetical protein